MKLSITLASGSIGDSQKIAKTNLPDLVTRHQESFFEILEKIKKEIL